MNKFAAALVSTAAVTVLTALAGIAHAEPKAPKATTCAAWFIKDGVLLKDADKAQSVLICVDKAKPFVMTSWQIVEVKGELGTSRLAVGYR